MSLHSFIVSTNYQEQKIIIMLDHNNKNIQMAFESNEIKKIFK